MVAILTIVVKSGFNIADISTQIAQDGCGESIYCLYIYYVRMLNFTNLLNNLILMQNMPYINIYEIHIHTRAHMYTPTYACTRVHAHTRTHVHTHLCMHTRARTHANTCTLTHACARTRTHTQRCTHILMSLRL